MSYRVKNGKTVRAERTKVRKFKRPADLPEYQESPEEIAARTGDVIAFDRRVYPDGLVSYSVPGLEPDTAETLEADGLIKHYKQDGSYHTEVYEPGNPRVLAWQVGVNEYCALLGVLRCFPGIPVAVTDHETVQ
jgi:hypothetical protein